MEASISDCEQTSLEKNIEAGLYVGDFLCNDEGIACEFIYTSIHIKSCLLLYL